MSSSFCHFHVHSDYSLLKSSLRVDQIVSKSLDLGFSHLSLSDMGNLYGGIEFYTEAKKQAKKRGLSKVNPIIGSEITFYEDNGEERESFSLVLYGINYKGYQNLIKISSQSFLNHKETNLVGLPFSYLNNKVEGIVVLTGSQNGLMGCLLREERQKAERLLGYLLSIFPKENIYIELLRHSLEKEEEAIQGALQLARHHDLKEIACSEVFYGDSGDASSNKVLRYIGEGEVISQKSKVTLVGDGYHLRSEEEMIELFADIPLAIDHVRELSNRCSIEFPEVIPHMPKTEVNSKSSDDLLTEECLLGLKKKGLEKKEYTDRLYYELGVISKMGFPDYFLIVNDFIRACRDKGILVGPGRGSVAGSLVAFSLEITKMDPISEGLLFERFLNPQRVNMPDIDIDFQDNRRDEVIEYCKEKYGSAKVAQIITYGKLKARAIFKDVTRVFEVDFEQANYLSQLIEANNPLKESYENNMEFRELIQANPVLKDVYFHSLKLEGLTRQTGVHASGVIISDKDIQEYAPICLDRNGDLCTQYEGSKLEEYCGLIKMDFLGLNTLGVLNQATAYIEENYKKKIDIDNLDFKDKKTFELFAKAQTLGVFQFESVGMRRYLKELKSDQFNDLVAMNAMFRPGPMSWIPVYIATKNKIKIDFDREEDKKDFEKLKLLCQKNSMLNNTLKVTNLIPVYQEQIMEIGRIYAGFTLGEADIMRRAMGKKDLGVLVEMKNKFIQGGSTLGNDPKDSEFLFEKIILPFSGYGFNKSHAACYAYIAYQSAYLKTHYAECFFCALMNADIEKQAKLKVYTEDAFQMGVHIHPPDINEGEIYFKIQPNTKKINYGLGAIKGIAESAGRQIVEERNQNGDFLGFIDFLERMSSNGKINKQTIEKLIGSGAFNQSETKINPKGMLEVYLSIIQKIERRKEKTKGGQGNLFSENDKVGGWEYLLKSMTEEKMSELEIDELQKDAIGFAFSGLQKWFELTEYGSEIHVDISSETELSKGKMLHIVGIISESREITTKNGDLMMMLNLTNLTGNVRGVIFPNYYKKVKEKLESSPSNIFRVKGRGKKDMRGLSLIIEDIHLPLKPDPLEENKKETKEHQESVIIDIKKLGINLNESKFKEMDLDLVHQKLSSLPKGNTMIYFYFKTSDIWMKLPEYRLGYSLKVKETLEALSIVEKVEEMT